MSVKVSFEYEPRDPVPEGRRISDEEALRLIGHLLELGAVDIHVHGRGRNAPNPEPSSCESCGKDIRHDLDVRYSLKLPGRRLVVTCSECLDRS